MIRGAPASTLAARPRGERAASTLSRGFPKAPSVPLVRGVVADGRRRRSTTPTPSPLPPRGRASVAAAAAFDDADDAPPPLDQPSSLSLVRAPVLALFNSPLLPTATGAVRLFEPRCLAALEASLLKSSLAPATLSSSERPRPQFVHLLSPSRSPVDLLSKSHGLPRVGCLAEITSVESDGGGSPGSAVVVRYSGLRRVSVLSVEDDVSMVVGGGRGEELALPPRPLGAPSTSPYPAPSRLGKHKVASCVFVDDEPAVPGADGIPTSVPLSSPPPASAGDDRENKDDDGSKSEMTISIDNPRAAALERELSAALSAVASIAAKRAREAGSPEPTLPEAVSALAPPPDEQGSPLSPSSASPLPGRTGSSVSEERRRERRKGRAAAVAQGLRDGGFRAAASAVDVWRRHGAKEREGAKGDEGGDASPRSSPGAYPASISSPTTSPPHGPRRRELFSFAAASVLDLDPSTSTALLLSTSTEARLEFVLSAVREHLGELTAREALRGIDGVAGAVPSDDDEGVEETS